ncbi:hypothetical protein [Rhizobium leguminosarum]|uniref:hypothetical protein n=1 Tax=Rhizobium leguminosarum TaxID=384 RepID=UPI001440E67E|nr:hypothetical protein [Rhizobium leguminosarum]NKJ77763.1 hypothetical protein [Rhizobium leguminosarum bv. viciae]
MLIRPSIVDFSTIPLPPGVGRGITEAVSWEEFGEFTRDVNGDGFTLRIPGKDKCILDYSCAGDWAAPAFKHLPLHSEIDVTVIKPWHHPVPAGQTSVTLLRTPHSADDMLVFLDDKTFVTGWTLVHSGGSPTRVVTVPAQTRLAYVEYRPRIHGFLTAKNDDGQEWNADVNWNLQIREK